MDLYNLTELATFLLYMAQQSCFKIKSISEGKVEFSTEVGYSSIGYSNKIEGIFNSTELTLEAKGNGGSFSEKLPRFDVFVHQYMVEDWEEIMDRLEDGCSVAQDSE